MIPRDLQGFRGIFFDGGREILSREICSLQISDERGIWQQ